MNNENFLDTIPQEIFSQLQRSPEESEVAYIKRVSPLKEQTHLTWREFASIINEVAGVARSEDAYQKAASRRVLAEEQTLPEVEISELKGYLDVIRKERVKLSDERTQLNAYVRRLAREDTLQEIAESVVEKIANKKPIYCVAPYNKQENINGQKEAILLISDWHFGLDFNNTINKYNPEICRDRVRRLACEVTTRAAKEKVTRITVLNLSDLIAGRIHTQIRIQSREDVVSQIMEVSEIVAEMLTMLAHNFDVRYYDCLDNHSRIEPDKTQSLDLESLARFIPFYLRARLKDISNIEICDNDFSEDIITCEVCGHNVVGVHGDRDKPITALDKITLLTRKSYDLMCTAHLHHFSADEKCGCITIGNGSLMGTDDYAMQLRLFSKPSQTLIIVTPENACDAIYKINLE